MILWWLLVTINWGPVYGENHQPALRFVIEPPYRVDFYNSNGTVIPCSASGEPLPITVNWESHDGAYVTNITGLRSVRPDGKLVFPPFSAKDYRQDIHATTYRCVLSNSVGKISSRDVHVLAVVHQDYNVQVVNGYSIQGNIAVLRCNIPSFVKDYVTVTSWKRGDNLKIISDFETGGRYLVFPTGELHIQNACAKDGFTTYSCTTRNSMRGEVKSSRSFGKLVVSDDKSNRPPRINHSQTRVGIEIGQDVVLPCAAQGFPPPIYMWYRYTNDIYPKTVPVVYDARLVKIGGSLLLRKVTPEDSGKYVCLVKNNNGQDKTEINLTVRENLHVSVVPVVHTVDVGKSAVFQCNVSGQPVTFLTWKKDHEHLTHINRRVHFVSETVLEIRHVQRQDKGLYQCFVCNDKDCAQGTAELKLGDITPILKESFRSVTLEPGSILSLKCIASGNPLPEVRWTLDDYPIPGHIRFSVGDFVTSKAEVVSYVNVTHVRVEDGGYYKCQATNDVGSVFNREKINVIGPPFVRPMKNTTAVEGRTFYTRCPASGYPVEEISWEHNGRRIPYNHRQRAFSNGSLIIRNVDQRSDEGEYSCTARNQRGQRGHGKMFVDVLIPPNIEPFTIPTGLEDGSRSRILCSVTKGDTPIRISWLKNGKAIPPHLGIIESAIDEFSTFLTFPQLQLKHGGNYTCVAKNIAALTNYTARMVIYAPPRWINEPRDTSAILNSDVIINCQADGFPKPGITWRKSKGSVSSEYVSLRTNAHINVVTNGSLAIRKVEKDDAGFYMCQAINGIGPGISAVVKLRIKVPAYFVNEFKAETIRKGHLLQITCQIFGDHPLTVQWKKDGENLDFRFDRRYDITQSLTNDGMMSQLQVLSADRRDSSLFTCLGSNNFGSDEMNIQIIVQEPPDRPSNIRVEQVESRKITLSWSAPYSGNSPITRYILIYWSEEDHDHQNRKEMVIPASQTNVVVKGLLPATEYHFHLLAENAVGRSDLSEEITATSNIEVPGGPPQDVRVEVLGSQLVRVTWKSPEPHLTHGPIKGYYVGYKVHRSSEAYTYKTMNANFHDEKLTCFLKNLKKLTRYKIIVQAFNIKGAGPPSDEVLFVTLDNDPPTAPKLKVASVSFTSIQVTWTVQRSDNIPISGFILNHKRDTENWIKTRLPDDSRMYTFYGLQCGTRFEFFILAFNDIGESFPSNTIQVKTRGAAPSSPTQHAFISVNVTSATLHFMEWDSGGCPVSYFVIQYKAEVSKDWIVVSERIFPQTLTYIIGGLTPATWYQLRVVAHNDAGSTRADYSYVTLPLSSQTSSTATSNSLPFYTNLAIIIPVIVACVILAVVVVIVCSVTRRRQGRRDTRGMQKEFTTESVPMSEVESKPTTDCVYSRPKSCLNYPSPYASNCVPFDHRHNLRSEDSRIERHSTVDSKRIYDVPFAMREQFQEIMKK
ncbi:Down syndrome cell adhesion molecule-like protein Dscam2 isoform X2 [Limulus polyphemus]|uniref:Down syndrome cell adhesion molecule-like protein Dscam2 isoform X2 n=1 Tax=Limulus polyphemus TaxID=6850 RepID=A0ABM1S8Y4_LIMPO|nr:Down syndrome cell adhesion molecule-like protein Dscam2 isoform X2 [Limulus polyphemus]